MASSCWLLLSSTAQENNSSVKGRVQTAPSDVELAYSHPVLPFFSSSTFFQLLCYAAQHYGTLRPQCRIHVSISSPCFEVSKNDIQPAAWIDEKSPAQCKTKFPSMTCSHLLCDCIWPRSPAQKADPDQGFQESCCTISKQERQIQDKHVGEGWDQGWIAYLSKAGFFPNSNTLPSPP